MSYSVQLDQVWKVVQSYWGVGGWEWVVIRVDNHYSVVYYVFEPIVVVDVLQRLMWQSKDDVSCQATPSVTNYGDGIKIG